MNSLNIVIYLNSWIINIQQMSTDSCADIFYQVKKQILDKLDLILQKVNLEIINSTHSRTTEHVEDFTFIELSHFEQQISALFLYLDKLYESLNSSVSGYTSMEHISNCNNPQSAELQSINQKLQSQNKQIKLEVSQIDRRLQQHERKAKTNELKNKKLTMKVKQLLRVFHNEHQELSMLKKSIAGKLKQFKFEMLQTRVEIIARIKQCQQWQNVKQKQKGVSKQKQRQNYEAVCHHLSHDQINIINELNQILKIC